MLGVLVLEFELWVFLGYLTFLLVLYFFGGVAGFCFLWFSIILSNKLFLWLTPSFLSSTSIWAAGVTGDWVLVVVGFCGLLLNGGLVAGDFRGLVVVGCSLWVGCLGLLATGDVVVGFTFGTWGVVLLVVLLVTWDIGLGFVLVVTSGCSCWVGVVGCCCRWLLGVGVGVFGGSGGWL